jgi:hypothetical protein
MATITIANDPFTYANQTGWPSPWSQTSGTGVLSIASNQGILTSPASTDYMVYTGATAVMTADVYARFTTSGNTNNVGVLARYINASNLARLVVSNGLLRVDVIFAGTTHSLTAGTFTVVANTSYRVHLNCHGNVYSANVWLDGSGEPGGWMYQQIDTNNYLQVPGSCGLYAFVNTSTTIKFDSFVASFTPGDYYVATTGLDSNVGSLASPWLTIGKAALSIGQGDTVHVAVGTYSETLQLLAGGIAGYPVTFISDTPHAASIVSPSTTLNAVGFYAPYTIVDSFDIQAPNYAGCVIFQNGANGSILRRCAVHNTARSPFTAGGGINAPLVFSGTITIDSNLVYDIGYAHTGAGQIHGMYLEANLANGAGRVTNNIVANIPWGYGIQLWGNPHGWDVANNTIMNCSEHGITAGSDVALDMANDRVLNNIIYGCKGPVRTNVTGTIGTGVIFENNLDFLCANLYTQVDAAVTLLNNISNANPQFANYQADGSGDYHIRTNSLCINAGTAAVTLTTDYEGNTRPVGAGYDIGAYENSALYGTNIWPPVSYLVQKVRITCLGVDRLGMTRWLYAVDLGAYQPELTSILFRAANDATMTPNTTVINTVQVNVVVLEELGASETYYHT